MDSSIIDSPFEDGGSSDFEMPAQPKKLKAIPKKPSKETAKPKAAPKKALQTTLKPAKAAPKKRAKPDSDVENTDLSMDESIGNNSHLSVTPPSAKKHKKLPAPKKSGGKPLQPISNETHGTSDMSEARPSKKASATAASEQYQKLTQLEHILKRPDTYIGSVEKTEKQMWVFNSETEAMQLREITYVPGLYKIFDEVLVNAADNKQRDKSMNEIRVTVDREKGEISVKNNGRGIPIEVHQKERIFVPEMIFGNLLTSSNYDDDQQKVTGGRNGYGAKLCNIFSTEFTLETVDSNSNKKYTQTWTNNMGNMSKAKITSCKGDDFTKVTFTPDFGKFGMDGMDDDFEALVKRRVYDMAGTCKGVKVYLNGDRIKINDFKKYMAMYAKAIKSENMKKENEEGNPETQTVILTDNHERWEIGFAVSDGSFQQVSFVNSIATTSGGTHVNYVADQIVNRLMDIVKKRNRGGVPLKNHQIRNHIFLFVNCLIVNPAFTSQTKEQLTTKATQFGSKCTVTEKFLKDIARTEAVNNIMHFAQQKADQVLKKSDGSRRSRMDNAKLTDANKAGTKDGYKCTLILTEGDSASLLALAGRAVVNPDLFGVFPLRGKLLNVRDASIDQISKNQEIQNIKKFIGLQHKKDYQDTRGLRYGHLMIMTDQDHDGSHIKGLLINFLQVSFPSLLKIPGFLMEFITPIVKVWKGDRKNPTKEISFYTMPEYEEWRQQPGHRSWSHRYFKGLGTSQPSDGEVYFRDLDRHLKEFHTMQEHDAELIDLAFSKKKADARKNWLREYQPGTYLDMTASKISYDDFINKELILFSIADNLRSIPSVVDGLKPTQRKVMYTCFRRNLRKEIKVVELAGSVSGMTAYAYGDASLQQTIVGLAQNFVGSNNINYLEPDGNFGSRLQGGNDAASARYIYTCLSPYARKMFSVADEPLLAYNLDDGETIEPEVYVPVVPLILINGAEGIGTGWSSSIPNYHPEDVVENLKRRMLGSSKEDMQPMKPWFRGWTGEVEDIGGDRFRFSGRIKQTGDNEVEITELPVRTWTQDFKERLEEIIKAEKAPSFIKDYTEYNTPEHIHFIIKMEDKHMKAALERGLEETFKLTKTMATTNLVAFDSQGRIHKYATILDIMEEFYQVRLKFYEKRKQYLLTEMQRELEKYSNQARFIKMIIDGSLVVSKKKKAVLVAELRKLKFKPFPKIADARKEGEMGQVVEAGAGGGEDDEDEDADVKAAASDYDYLLGMAIWSLTQERVDKLQDRIREKEDELDALIKTIPKDIWKKDLDGFVSEWKFQLDREAQRTKQRRQMGRRASTKLKIGGKPGGKKRRANDSDGYSDSDFGVSKAKKKGAASRVQAKPSTLTNYLAKPSTAKEAAAKPLVNAVEQKPVARPPADTKALALDGNAEPTKGTTVPPGKSKAASKITKAIDLSDDSDDMDDEFMEIAKEANAKSSSTAPARAGRAARAKPTKYILSDDSDSNEDDMLGDVSTMVKGIGSKTVETGRPLFSASASRPSSAHGRPKAIGRPSRGLMDTSSGADETDYTKLAPQESPHRPAIRPTRPPVPSDDDEDSDLPSLSKATDIKKKAKPAAKAAVSSTKLKSNKAASSLMDGKAGTAPKQTTLSPSAKAYAAKIAKEQAATSKTKVIKPVTKKTVESGSEDEDGYDVDNLAHELVSDEDEAPKTTARPGRRAVASKAKYIISDDEDSQSEEEEDFDDDDMTE